MKCHQQLNLHPYHSLPRIFRNERKQKKVAGGNEAYLRRLIRNRIQKKFNMYDRIYGRPENVYIDCKDPDRKVETKRKRLTCLSSDSCNGIGDCGLWCPQTGSVHRRG